MAHLPQLRNVESYRPCEWDLKSDAAGRRYWVELFCGSIDVLAAAIREAYPETPVQKLETFRAEYLAAMQSVAATPERFERIDILLLDELRTDLQRRYGFDDPHRVVKTRENALALKMLPALLAELDASPADGQVEQLALGLMAGNIFDVGAAAALERFHANGADFRRLRECQPPRPWLIDDVGVWRRRWEDGAAYEHVAFFVDNAGADICLGCLPLARWMLERGSRVTLAANSGPALNDVTAPELKRLLDDAGAVDRRLADAVASGRLVAVESGGWAPLLDLTQLSEACVKAVADAVLLIFLGMGRAIESNFRITLSCDSLRAAVLKDPAIATWVGGRLFDCVFRFEPAG